MKDIIAKAIQSSISFEEYKELFEKVVKEGKTTGTNQSEGYVSYTKLNWSRYKRALKQVELSEDMLVEIQNIEKPITLLVITEVWCGDASQIVPVLELISNSSINIVCKIVFRDEHEELMNLFLTNGGKAIPKILVLDEQYHVLNSWGPRPSVMQQQVVAFKTENPTAKSMDVAHLVQKWYNDDNGQITQHEIIALINNRE